VTVVNVRRGTQHKKSKYVHTKINATGQIVNIQHKKPAETPSLLGLKKKKVGSQADAFGLVAKQNTAQKGPITKKNVGDSSNRWGPMGNLVTNDLNCDKAQGIEAIATGLNHAGEGISQRPPF